MHPPLYRLCPVLCAVLSLAGLAAPPASAQATAQLHPSATSPGSASTPAAMDSNGHIGLNPAGFIEATAAALAEDSTDNGLYLFPPGIGNTSAADMADMKVPHPLVPVLGLASGAYAAVGPPALRITGISTFYAPGYVPVGVSLTNTGASDATNVQLTAATLRTARGTAFALDFRSFSPIPVGNIPVGRTIAVSLLFLSGYALSPSGARAILRIDGTFDGGSFFGLQGATTTP